MAGFMVRIIKNIRAMQRNWADFGVYFYIMVGAPTSGASGTGVGVLDLGSEVMDSVTGNWYTNVGTISVPVWVLTQGPANIITAKVTLTSAQVKALRATPITVAPAPGAGFVNDLISWSGYLKAGANVFTNPQDLAIKPKDGTIAQVSESMTAAGWLDQATSFFTTGLVKKNVPLTKASVDNQPLVVHNIGASEITGNAAADATITIVIAYRVVAITW
jgi:hypothetical protein